MTEPIVLDGLPGGVHATCWDNNIDTHRGQHVDMGSTVGTGPRLLEIDGVFYVGTTEVRLVSVEPRGWTTLLHGVASFDNLDAAIMCFRLEYGS